jgi:NAD-dependent SIR2 family protein deacetylase
MTTTSEPDRALEAIVKGTRVVWLTGAGISVASGISPYRKSADAVWENYVTDWGTMEKFRADPAAWYRGFWWRAHKTLLENPGLIKPNPAHDAVAHFVRTHEHHGLITQNIDGLHGEAGAPRERLIEIHGRHDVYCCANRNCSHHGTPLSGVRIDALGEHGAPPECEWCGHALRPLVLMFDERYESHPIYRAREARAWLNDADVVVFVGTSFSVGITAMALQAARYNEARLINVNLEPIDELGFINVLGPSEQTLPALATAAGL